MCKKCVQALSVISEGMNLYLMGTFDEAIRRDMSQEMNDEEGMFHLLVFELASEGLKNTVDLAVMEVIIEETAEALFNGNTNTLRAIFEQQWA